MNEDRQQDLVPPAPASLLAELAEMAQRLDRGEVLPAPWTAECIYDGRNRLYRIGTPGGASYVVKSFARLSLPKRLYYSFLGESKARRSHLNAKRLVSLGFAVGESLGYVERRSALGLLEASYYVSAEILAQEPHLHFHARGWRAPEGFVPALGRYIARLHERGVMHLDLSAGNILYHYDATSEAYEFYLVDLNRMAFLGRPAGQAEAMANLCRLMSCPSVTRQLAEAYAEARGWDPGATSRALSEASDRFWGRRLFKLAKRWSGRSWLSFAFVWYGHLALRALLACPLGEGGLRTWMLRKAEHLYTEYLSAEDLRRVLRHRYGYGYRLPSRYRSL